MCNVAWCSARSTRPVLVPVCISVLFTVVALGHRPREGPCHTSLFDLVIKSLRLAPTRSRLHLGASVTQVQVCMAVGVNGLVLGKCLFSPFSPLMCDSSSCIGEGISRQHCNQLVEEFRFAWG